MQSLILWLPELTHGELWFQKRLKGRESSLELDLAGLKLPSKQEMLYSTYRSEQISPRAGWMVLGLFLSETSASQE